MFDKHYEYHFFLNSKNHPINSFLKIFQYMVEKLKSFKIHKTFLSYYETLLICNQMITSIPDALSSATFLRNYDGWIYKIENNNFVKYFNIVEVAENLMPKIKLKLFKKILKEFRGLEF
jgi:hypothetical protein